MEHKDNKIIAPIYLDANWSENEKTALKEAIKQWNWALNNEIILEVKDENYIVGSTPDPGLIFIKISEKDSIVKNDEGLLTAYAWTNKIGGNRIYFITDRLIAYEVAPKKFVDFPWTYKDITSIALHEMGHAFGSKHLEYNGLMAPSYNGKNYKCIDQAAILTVASYQHIPTSNLRYCSN